MALAVESTVVPFESSIYSIPSMTATVSNLCERPLKSFIVPSIDRAFTPAIEHTSIEARIFSVLCAPFDPVSKISDGCFL